MIVRAVAVALDEFVAFGGLEVFSYHFRDQRLERYPGLPAQLAARFARVAEQRIDFRWAEVARIDAHDSLSARRRTAFCTRTRIDDSHFFHAFAAPVEFDSEFARRG